MTGSTCRQRGSKFDVLAGGSFQLQIAKKLQDIVICSVVGGNLLALKFWKPVFHLCEKAMGGLNFGCKNVIFVYFL